MPPLRLALLAALALPLLACAGPMRFVPTRAGGFVERQAAGHKHFVYLPADWTPDRRWPVILYLHGGGERGDDGVRATQVGLGPYAWKSGGKLPFVVVFPQCRRGAYWPEPEMRQRALDALDAAVRDFAGDPDRVYLTGNSMGGFGTWLVAARSPGRFAALVPIASGVKPPFGRKLPTDDLFKEGEDPEAAVARAVGKTPVWVMHGRKDWLVPASGGRRMADKVNAAGGSARYTEFADAGHNSEDWAYAMPELFEWLAAQHR